jgi:Cu2+-exporting ATPase
VPACEHCLLPVASAGAVRDPDGRLFCCAGCRAVNAFIRAEGLASFYERRGPETGGRAPAAPAPIADLQPFQEIVREAGGHREIDLYVERMHCASCVWLVERVLSRTPGVLAARVGYVDHRARVRWDPGAADLAGILARISSAGYAPRPCRPGAAARARRDESRDLLVRFGTAAFLSAQLMVYSLALYAGYFQGIDQATKRTFGAISLLLTTPVLLYAGRPLLATAAAGLRHGRFTTDSLIVLGAWSAFFAGAWALVRGGEVYFDTAAMIVTLVLLGRLLESRARARAAESLERLAELAPRHAVRVRLDRDAAVCAREPVEIDALRRGDLVEVLPGAKFPADGAVVRGESAADESLLSGESRAVPKAPGDPVLAGSVNDWGALVFEVRGTGAETTLARIVAAVEQAQASRPRIQGLADRVVGWFVPAVLALAAAATIGHLVAGEPAQRALMDGVSVLVIACPCSLGLATPLAVLHYLARAAAQGVLIKSGETAESAAAVTTVVLDKTGTLTRGTPALREIAVLDAALDRDRCLELAASLEALSGHAVGAAIVAAAAGLPLREVTGFRAWPGRGVSGCIGGAAVLAGNRAFMAEHGVEPGPPDGDDPREPGPTTVLLAWDGAVRARFVLDDLLREEAPEAVRALRAAGLGVSLVSGDNAGATAAAARGAGIDRFEAEATPARKREIVAARQARGEVVLAVGDGVNDAPALAEAAVGVAVGRGADVTRESAGLVLLRPDLRLVPWFLALSRGTFAIIRQNLFWAFFYNAAALPLAVAGLLHPIVAAAAMTASSVFVVANSQRIRRLSPAPQGNPAAGAAG